MNEAFLIVNLAPSLTWEPCHGGQLRIPMEQRPTVLQTTEVVALAELERLSLDHPAGEFVLFRAASKALRVSVPTHVTLGGRVVSSRPSVQILPIVDGDADEVPF